MMGINFVPVGSTLASAVRLGLVSSMSVQNSLGQYLPGLAKGSSPFARNDPISFSDNSSSNMPL
jgi:hypothetical protein